jgi:mRNA-degrading endonuclease RelE of RelBE toxin-antitoxin system
MFKIIVPKATFKELEKVDVQNQKLIFEKIKELEIL